MADMLIRNGTVVDGTGAAAFTADVRVSDGMIAEVGAGPVPNGRACGRCERLLRHARLHRKPHPL